MKNMCVQKRNTMFLDNMKVKVGKLEAGRTVSAVRKFSSNAWTDQNVVNWLIINAKGKETMDTKYYILC
jgi:hypothetical protein